MKILAMSGSLRQNSSNHSILAAIKNLLPERTIWNLFDIASLPYFDPDLQFSNNLPPKVKEIRLLAQKADLILISTPEYAHSIPGVLKNALEWLLCEETMKKKMALVIGAASGGEFVKAHLIETLKTMDYETNENRILTLRTAKNQISTLGLIQDPSLEAKLKQFIHRIQE